MIHAQWLNSSVEVKIRNFFRQHSSGRQYWQSSEFVRRPTVCPLVLVFHSDLTETGHHRNQYMSMYRSRKPISEAVSSFCEISWKFTSLFCQEQLILVIKFWKTALHTSLSLSNPGNLDETILGWEKNWYFCTKMIICFSSSSVIFNSGKVSMPLTPYDGWRKRQNIFSNIFLDSTKNLGSQKYFYFWGY